MIPFVLSSGKVSRYDLDVAGLCCEFMKSLPEPDDHPYVPHHRDKDGKFPMWSCHGLTRGFVRLLANQQWQVSDGYFGQRGQEHSWLWRRDAEREVILDVYPVAAMGPLLVDGSRLSPWAQLYAYMPRLFTEDDYARWEKEGNHAYAKFIEAGTTSH